MNKIQKQRILINAGEWSVEQAEKLIKKYKSCKTQHAKTKLLPDMACALERLSFERKEIEKILP